MIENRNLLVGSRLVANYKKVRYACQVVVGEGGEGVAFVLENGQRFKSPSAAGSAVMAGAACNGWKFWSLEGAAPGVNGESAYIDALLATPEPKPAKPKSGGKGKKTIYRIPPGPNLGEGKSKWICVSCMKSFVVEGTDPPAACPEGHPMQDVTQEEVAS